MRIKVFEHRSEKPNGDRAVALSPSSAFEVVLENDQGERTVVFKNDQFDHWWCHINGSRSEYRAAAVGEAEKLSRVLGGVPISYPEDTEKELRVMTVKKKIARLQKELEELE